jgi:hypothetical protein
MTQEEVLKLLKRLSVIAGQIGFIIPEDDYKKSEQFFRFSGKKENLLIEVQLTSPDMALIRLTEMDEAGRPRLGSNVLTTHFNVVETHMSTMLNEYFR